MTDPGRWQRYRAKWRLQDYSLPELLCDIMGLAAVTVGCFLLWTWLGFMIMGLLLLVLGWRLSRWVRS